MNRYSSYWRFCSISNQAKPGKFFYAGPPPSATHWPKFCFTCDGISRRDKCMTRVLCFGDYRELDSHGDKNAAVCCLQTLRNPPCRQIAGDHSCVAFARKVKLWSPVCAWRQLSSSQSSPVVSNRYINTGPYIRAAFLAASPNRRRGLLFRDARIYSQSSYSVATRYVADIQS